MADRAFLLKIDNEKLMEGLRRQPLDRVGQVPAEDVPPGLELLAFPAPARQASLPAAGPPAALSWAFMRPTPSIYQQSVM